MSITQKLSEIVGQAFVQSGLDKELGRVTVSDRPELAQFQCNGAMAAAKQAKKNPREVAAQIAELLQKKDIFEKVDIAGPGFINISLTDEALAGFVTDFAAEIPQTGQGHTAIVDYGGANIAKPMHAGHLRPAVIGDAVYRIMKAAGYRTLGDVHMGDWGTHIGMLINDYLSHGEENLVLNTDLSDVAQIDTLMDDMAMRYPRASVAAKENPELMAQAQAVTVKLQNKEAPYYPIWEKIRAISVEGLKRTYGLLDVHFDLWKGEADVHDLIAPMVDDLRAKNYAIESDGAWIVPVVSGEDKKEYPPLILYKRDGAVMYGTTDMATILERVKLYDPDKIVYVVDQRQSLHFEQVFRAVQKSGIVGPNVELTHAGFGTLNGPDGKPFKTRDGGVMRLEEFIQMTIDKASERLTEANLAADMPEGERQNVARQVALAAIKFADLQNDRKADYIFDPDRLTRFEGKTGPYLLYQAVRIKSLLGKAGNPSAQAPLHLQETDRDLALALTQMQEAFDLSLKHYAPHYLCEYAHRLAQAFSSFYGNCHILSEEDEELRASRLALCALTYQKLETVLGLLGISLPERM